MDELDCEGLARLLENGFPLFHALELLKNHRNQTAITSIESKLAQGIPITSFFAECCPKRLRRSFTGFSACLNFEQSLSLSIAITQSEKKMLDDIRKTVLYPCTLLLGCIFGLILFNNFILPPMLDLLSGFQTELNGFDLLALFARSLTLGSVALTLSGISLSIYLRNNERRIKAYLFLNRIVPDSVIVLNESIAFIRFYEQCVIRHISTKQTMELFHTLDRPILVYMAGAIETGLLNGDRFEDAMNHSFFDSALGRFLKIAVYSGDMESLLGGYLGVSLEKRNRKLRRIAKGIQLFAYGLIGLMMIFVYRILLIPLNVIATI